MIKQGIRIELSKLWRKNVDEIRSIMHFTQNDISEKFGVTRQSISTWLTRPDFHLTAVQFLGSLHGIREMINESEADERNKKLAYEYLEEIESEYEKNGLH